MSVQNSANTAPVATQPHAITLVHANTAIEHLETDVTSCRKVWVQSIINCLIPCVAFFEAAGENALNATNINSNLKHALDIAIEKAGGDITTILGAAAAGDSNIKDVIAQTLKSNEIDLATFVTQVVNTKSLQFINFVGTVLDKKITGLDASDKAKLIATIQNSLTAETNITLVAINDAINNNVKSALSAFAQNTGGNIANAALTMLDTGSDIVRQLVTKQVTSQMANLHDAEKAFVIQYLLSLAAHDTQITQNDLTNLISSHFAGAIHAYIESTTHTDTATVGMVSQAVEDSHA